MTDEEDVRPDDAAPGRPAAPATPPLTPSRPWQVGDAPRGRPRAARPYPDRPRATPFDEPPPLDPPRPWLRAPQQPPGTPGAEADLQRDAGSRAPGADAEPGPVPGLTPIRPWTVDATGEPPGPRLPQPSNPDVVLQDLAADLAPDRRLETDEERRRRFARQHAAADAARRAALPPPSLIDSGPLPPSYEPDPAVYDVAGDEDDGPRKRRFGVRRRGRDAEPDRRPEPIPVDDAPAAHVPPGPPVRTPKLPRASRKAKEPAAGPPAVEAPTYDPDPLTAEPPLPVIEPAVAAVVAPAVDDAPPAVASEAPEQEPKQRWRRGRPVESPFVVSVAQPTPETAPAVEPVPEPSPADDSGPGPIARVARWVFARSPAPTATPEQAAAPEPEPVGEVRDSPVEPDAASSEPPDEVPADVLEGPIGAEVPAEPVRVAPRADTGRRRWRRAAKDDDEGPFFPPEPPADAVAPVARESAAPVLRPALDLPPVASVLDDVPLPAASEVPAVPVSRNRPRPRPRPPTAATPPPPPSAEPPPPPPALPPQRPRPRPAAARAAASPAAETSTEPDPAGSAASAPSSDEPATTAGSDYRSPDISRYLEAGTDAAPDEEQAVTKRRFVRRRAKAQDRDEPTRGRRRLRGSRGLRIVTRLLIVAVVAVVAAAVLRAYVVAPYYIPSASMEPALDGGGGTNDRILVDKVTYRIHDPHQGDIVVFDRPDTWPVTYKTLVKRIIGLPGDIVTLRNGLVYVDGMRLTENYFKPSAACTGTKPLTRTTRWTVPMGDYFVMGDNRCNSEDSREFGPIPDSKIVGRAFLIVWPLSRFGTP